MKGQKGLLERVKKKGSFPVSSPLSHFHLDIWRNFNILLRAEHIVWKLNI